MTLKFKASELSGAMARINQYVKPDCSYVLDLHKAKTKRSLNQNKYYWGVIIPCIQNGLFETQGEWLTHDATHEFLKSNFNYKELVNESSGEIIKLPKSTTESDTFDFEEYLDKCRLFADEFLNIIIPMPNEQTEINY